MDSEVVHVQIEDIAHLKECKKLTYLLDGLYGSLAAEVNQPPIVLNLEDMTGHQGSADKLLEVLVKALERMEIGDGHNIIFQEKFYWVLTFPCFLHSLNTIIGEICAHPFMKQHVTKATRVVTFFNGSHYWGKKDGVNHGLKKNCESCWYALVLQSMSVCDHRQSLSHLCLREDAQKKIGGLLPVAPDIVTIVLCDAEFWPAIEQEIKVMKPIIDLIADEESHNLSLTSYMLGLIWLAKTISHLALFLHPMCQKLTISQAINGCSFKFMVELTKMLVADLKDYHKSSGVFSGGQADALNWWETLPVSAECFIIHSIIPHAADIKRYFSGLGGVQSVKRCNLSVQTFDYANFLPKPEHGIDTAWADELQRYFAWVPPLAGASRNSDDEFLAGTESITDEELLEEFDRFENKMLESQGSQEGTGEVPDIFKGDIIDWNELEKVDKGITPTGFVEEIDMVARGSQGMEPGWNINVLLTSEGVAQ
ncbi:hypothetical protein BD769DRAFT_1629766 [Suillus cothurnatus]|nr:hypothetical protein BD769DRAFT_1629766 [Suillus cothurnatus]